MSDKTPASRQLLNITKALLDDANGEIERLRAEADGLSRSLNAAVAELDEIRNETREECAKVMEHKHGKMAGRYVNAFSWHRGIRQFLDSIIKEAPLLCVCSGPVSDLGDVRCDRYVKPIPPGVIADWTSLPFADESFAAVFADPPWNVGYMKLCADFCKEALRIAPVAYVMSPWLWVHEDSRRSAIWVRELPGVNIPITIVRYERKNKDQLRLPIAHTFPVK